MYTRRFPRHLMFLLPLALVGFLAIFTYLVYALWNGVLVEVVSVKTITYWQALGLLVLAKILFGGFPFKGPSWREKMLAKRWATLSPEQREKLRHEMRCRFGDWPHPPWDEADEGTPRGPANPPPPSAP